MTNTTNVTDEVINVTVSDTGLRGRPGIVWRGAFDGTSTYYLGDTVNYLGSTYISNSFQESPTSFDHDSWSLLVEKGDPVVTTSGTAPTDPRDGDLWFDTETGRLYARVQDADADGAWFDISGNVGINAEAVEVTAHGTMPAGSLQNALQHLADQQFVQDTAPTGTTTSEGDLWFDTTLDQMKVYRNGDWEALVTKEAADEGYDDISMNGGYF